jgi:hypothetical protein
MYGRHAAVLNNLWTTVSTRLLARLSTKHAVDFGKCVRGPIWQRSAAARLMR